MEDHAGSAPNVADFVIHKILDTFEYSERGAVITMVDPGLNYSRANSSLIHNIRRFSRACMLMLLTVGRLRIRAAAKQTRAGGGGLTNVE
ncbi:MULTISPECIES: hypothetical protein [unclassified Mesorhizobium]|uniref:hypothetical protein n=1 Tax=unclassified Mesorhizobium TaxID=325217 RepID=UPI0011262B8F|nr:MULTISPECIES: hypothetical protein [unclassified Mesorhizobium]MBZ9860337.1 hypothetical protein [Mesorhizobium sp. CA12]TPI85460.1 hypothetical protein FJ423_03855 [Mesorhizobium sp. B2-8-9]